MVSSSISSPPKIPPLSYADRAKKAQNIKSPISLQSQRIAVQLAPTSSATSPVINPPWPSTSETNKQHANNLDVPRTSNDIISPKSSANSPPSLVADATDVNPTSPTKHVSNDLATKALSIVAARTSPPKSPMINVWNTRKEQMAAAARSAPQPNSSSLVSPSQTTLPSKSASSDDRASSKSSPSKIPRDSALNTSQGPSAATTVNGMTSVPPSVQDDPFVVRMYPKPVRVPIASVPPPAVDSESWPEVGKTSTTTTELPPAKENTESHSREGEQISSSNSRKSEKTKWVPIPPEELQAAADALVRASKRQSQSRKGSQHGAPSSRSGNSTTQGSAGPGQSRTHSASQSTSHSRVQSRSESLQSSPRFPKGRRLAGDDVSPVTGISVYGTGPSTRSHTNHAHSSRPNSPLRVQPHLQPPPQPLQGTQPPVYSDPSLPPEPMSIAYPVPVYSHGHPNGLVHYDPHAQTLSSQPHYIHTGGQSYHSSRGGSPPIPQPYPHAGPTYAMYLPQYRPYDYGSAAQMQPYGYWNGHSHPGSGHHSPAYTSQQHYMPLPQVYSQPQIHQEQNYQHSADVAVTGESMATGVGIGRPLPPDQSTAVAGYRPATVIAGDSAGVEKGKQVVFGSIGVPGASKCPSPALFGPGESDRMVEMEKQFTMFSIGVAPGEVCPRIRSRTHSTNARSRTATASDGGSLSEIKENVAGGGDVVAKVIDLTDSTDAKWEFGTATSAASTTLQGGDGSMDLLSPLPDDKSLTDPGVLEDSLRSHSGLSIAGFESSLPPSETLQTSSELRMRLEQLAAPPSAPADPTETDRDVFEVKDFGYGFGSGSRGSISPPEEANGEDRERNKEKKDEEVSVRPRRGSYYAGHTNERGGHERGTHGARRGRGMNGFGRGYNRRGGYQPPSQRQPPFSVTPPTTHFRPMVVMGDPTNGFYHALPPRPHLAYMPAGYEAYVPPPANMAMSHITPSHLTLPVPVPTTSVSFPLDSTRWYLLGQLEYYLSPQNMAQDFFLRQRMDSRGWISIPLLASFNRVRQLTMDLELVRDVLMLSSVTQVKDDWVRMNDWEQFVLPDAPPSSVESLESDGGEHYGQLYYDHAQHYDATKPDSLTGNVSREEEGVGNGDIDAEVEDEEEDVVFVMSHEPEGAGPWSTERRT